MIICQLGENKHWHCGLSHCGCVTNYWEVFFFFLCDFSFKGFGGYFSFSRCLLNCGIYFPAVIFTDGLTKLQSQLWLCLFPFMHTSAKFSNFPQPSYTLSQWKLSLYDLISHWLSTSMKQFLLAVVKILFSRHKQFWRFENEILLRLLGILKLTSDLITMNT